MSTTCTLDISGIALHFTFVARHCRILFHKNHSLVCQNWVFLASLQSLFKCSIEIVSSLCPAILSNVGSPSIFSATARDTWSASVSGRA